MNDVLNKRFGILQIIAGALALWAFAGLIVGGVMKQKYLLPHTSVSFWFTTMVCLLFPVLTTEISILRLEKNGIRYYMSEKRRCFWAGLLGVLLATVTYTAGVIK